MALERAAKDGILDSWSVFPLQMNCFKPGTLSLTWSSRTARFTRWPALLAKTWSEISLNEKYIDLTHNMYLDKWNDEKLLYDERILTSQAFSFHSIRDVFAACLKGDILVNYHLFSAW